ncbi:sulfite exporter TauE/SafE family protein [Kineosporia babensis]|uniref:Probable membrane transporter protein n=1 Tax=Kineosporia babensis TaxID=499548 RepID=A0A9X1NJ17_9ACTN|nr:sulfite exporter TauE/SafE family protein [Kineosporia babensis]
MTVNLILVGVGVLLGVSTVWFGFGGGFVAVPVIAWAHGGDGAQVLGIATATSLLIMLVNALVATLASRRELLARIKPALIIYLAIGGALGAAANPLVDGRVLKWAFVTYIGLTVLDLLFRPGFVHPDSPNPRQAPPSLGIPIGAVASFLGVGGSVLTVPAMRRSGVSMADATALANPLTFAIALPATLVALLTTPDADDSGRLLVGSADIGAAACLLVSAIPVVILLRRRRVPVPDTVHAWAYLVLLVISGAAVALR